jgi:hypothetical protein
MPNASVVAIVALLIAGAAGCARRDGIEVLRATYGASCGQPAGNVTMAVAERCDGLPACDLPVAPAALTDPAEGCEKDFEVLWACRSGQAGPRRIYLPKQATLGAHAQLACD